LNEALKKNPKFEEAIMEKKKIEDQEKSLNNIN
jgi:hypothetical protein